MDTLCSVVQLHYHKGVLKRQGGGRFSTQNTAGPKHCRTAVEYHCCRPEDSFDFNKNWDISPRLTTHFARHENPICVIKHREIGCRHYVKEPFQWNSTVWHKYVVRQDSQNLLTGGQYSVIRPAVPLNQLGIATICRQYTGIRDESSAEPHGVDLKQHHFRTNSGQKVIPQYSRSGLGVRSDSLAFDGSKSWVRALIDTSLNSCAVCVSRCRCSCSRSFKHRAIGCEHRAAPFTCPFILQTKK